MTRYFVSILLAVYGVFILLILNAPPAEVGRGWPPVLGAIDWLIIFGFVLLVVLSIWGMIGVALSNLEKKAEESAAQEAVISKKSWHYRLNTRVNFGHASFKVQSECEYWAKLFHGLYITPPIWIFVFIIYAVIVIGGWFFGARPNILNIFASKSEHEVPLFKPGRQFVGPVVLILGVVVPIVRTGFVASVASYPWGTIGVWAGISVGVIASLVVLFFLGKMVLRFAQPLFSYADAGIKGICRPVKFVD